MFLPVLASAKPIINSAVPNYGNNQLTIAGSGFGTATPNIKLDATPLTLVSHTSTTIVATLPSALSAGSFLLSVTASGATASLT